MLRQIYKNALANTKRVILSIPKAGAHSNWFIMKPVVIVKTPVLEKNISNLEWEGDILKID